MAGTAHISCDFKNVSMAELQAVIVTGAVLINKGKASQLPPKYIEALWDAADVYYDRFIDETVEDLLKVIHETFIPESWYEELRRAVEAKDYRKVRSLVLSGVDESERVSV